VGARWRRWGVGKQRPPELEALLTAIDDARDARLSQICGLAKWPVCTALLELHAMADAACVGVGIPGGLQSRDLFFYLEANMLLRTTGSLAKQATSRVRVMPKLRTPQVGISLRSLSHHLSIDRSEVATAWYWHSALTPPDGMHLNVLILPWPLKIEARDFREVDGPLDNMDLERFGFQTS